MTHSHSGVLFNLIDHATPRNGQVKKYKEINIMTMSDLISPNGQVKKYKEINISTMPILESSNGQVKKYKEINILAMSVLEGGQMKKVQRNVWTKCINGSKYGIHNR